MGNEIPSIADVIQVCIQCRHEPADEQTGGHRDADPDRQQPVQNGEPFDNGGVFVLLPCLRHERAPALSTLPESESASTVYTSHRSPAGPVTHTLSWTAKQQ